MAKLNAQSQEIDTAIFTSYLVTNSSRRLRLAVRLLLVLVLWVASLSRCLLRWDSAQKVDNS